MTWLCVQASAFCLWHSHTLFDHLLVLYHHGTMCRIHSWTLFHLNLWPHYQKYIFIMDLSLARCLCLLTQAYQIFGVGVSPWDNMLCTFLTLVLLWPLTCMYMAGVSLVSFTHTFYLVLFRLHVCWLHKISVHPAIKIYAGILINANMHLTPVI